MNWKYHINSDIKNVLINPNPTPSKYGTYSVIVTGWSNPHKWEFDSVPNLAAIGNLFSATMGVELLLESLSKNKIDRVYLINNTRQDKISGSCEEAYSRLTKLGITCYIGSTLPEEYLLPTGNCMSPYTALRLEPSQQPFKVNSPVVVEGTDLYKVHDWLTNYILIYGNHYPARNFTGVTNVVAHLTDYSEPPYEPYFDTWQPDYDLPKDIDYTYGILLNTHLSTLSGHKEDSTQSVASWDISGYKHPPCLISVTRFRNQLTAVFRSHDIGSAWIQNAKALQWFSYQINPGNQPKQLTIVSQMAHIYDYDLKPINSKELLDPLGHFYFLTNNKQVEVYFNDKLVYSSKSIPKIENWIAHNYNLSTKHAFWVKAELEKLKKR